MSVDRMLSRDRQDWCDTTGHGPPSGRMVITGLTAWVI